MTRCDGAFSQEALLRLYTSAPDAFWRHDVDVSLGAAARMARFAQLAGVRATFCVMARGEFYNPFCLAGERALTEILGAGQLLAPHVHYRHGGEEELAYTVAKDRALWATGYPGWFDETLVAFHMPPPAVLWHDFHSFDHAHASRWEGRYVSDSRREWTPEKAARVADGMQVALHPEHWMTTGS